jgi:hypothetical protein
MKRRDFLAAGIAASCLPTGARGISGTGTEPVRLVNELWAIQVEPRTFKLTVQPAGQAAVAVSRGTPSHVIDKFARTETGLAWTWDGWLDVACNLAGPDFSIAVTATRAGRLSLIDQPADAFGRGMMLPLGEGYYVPARDATWRNFLLEHKSELDTTQDLSLPLWGLDHGDFTLHWLLTNPFNNLLRFRDDEGGLGVMLDHSFTTLAPDKPMTLSLHLAAADLIAGSKRYRQHLIESDAYVPLAGKIAKSPAGRKLVGATHLYLWGNGLIGNADIRDWPAFARVLKGGSAVATALRARLEHDVLTTLATLPATPYAYQKQALIRGVNEALEALARSRWQKEMVSAHDLVAAYTGLRAEVFTEFGPALTADPEAWGEGLSKTSFAALTKAGLPNLWVGLGDGWEGGLWNPGAVRAGADAGYLIAPYDSYETAIAPGKRADWATAQLGRSAYEDCAIIQEDGSPKPGFQREGHYTNTLCVTPILKDRIGAIAKAAGFNSWFIDAFASGMVFDDYRPGHGMTMAENAAADIAACRWISESLDLPTGSEDGNAVTAAGVLFAHGVETPVIGWGDPELHKDESSPFFLGKWYPSDAPGVFFKAVPMKEPYRTIYFTPATRLPLYQGVFHGSVITTHHWLFDQLKIANATADRAIIQQLYNVPALFHVSAGSLSARLPSIRRHDAFFRPVHFQLAETTLERFDWLSADRQVQQTSFGDGTRLIANFDTAPRSANGVELPPQSVTALGIKSGPLLFAA